MASLHRENVLTFTFLSFFSAWLGSYVAVCLADEFRVSKLLPTKIFGPQIIIFLMALSLGGVAIFTTHFIGMGSIVLMTDDGEAVPISFNSGLTVVSLVAAVGSLYIGLLVSSRDRAFIKTREEIAEMTVKDASKMTIKEIRKTNFISMALCKNLTPLVVGGIIAGSGIVVMHYIGMLALEFPGQISWNIGIIAGSVIIAIIASIFAFWICFRLLALYPHNELFRIFAAVIMAVAVAGMHYTGAAAATFVYVPGQHQPSANSLVASEFGINVAITCAAVFIFLALFIMLFNFRYWLAFQSNALQEIDILVSKYKKVIASSNGNVVLASLSNVSNISTANNEGRCVGHDIESFVRDYDIIRLSSLSLSLSNQHKLSSSSDHNDGVTLRGSIANLANIPVFKPKPMSKTPARNPSIEYLLSTDRSVEKIDMDKINSAVQQESDKSDGLIVCP